MQQTKGLKMRYEINSKLLNKYRGEWLISLGDLSWISRMKEL
jgi:hypothetical protein